MKKNNKIAMSLLSALLFSVMLAGCQPKVTTTPDAAAKIYFNAIVKENKSEISKINVTDSEADKHIKGQKDKTCKEIKDDFTKEQISITDEQVQNLYNSLRQAFKKTSVTASVVSQDDKSAKVKVKSNYFDLTAEYSKAQTAAIAKVKSENLTDEVEARKQLVNEYINNVVEQLKNASPSNETKEKTFNFVLKNNTWVAEDTDNISQDFYDLIEKK